MPRLTSKPRPAPTDRMFRRLLAGESEVHREELIRFIFRTQRLVSELTGTDLRRLIAHALRGFRRELRSLETSRTKGQT